MINNDIIFRDIEKSLEDIDRIFKESREIEAKLKASIERTNEAVKEPQPTKIDELKDWHRDQKAQLNKIHQDNLEKKEAFVRLHKKRLNEKLSKLEDSLSQSKISQIKDKVNQQRVKDLEKLELIKVKLIEKIRIQ
ncbi:hypothetical protein [Flammeovirga sp. SJP92]|uniref:hypothetical protein n=1 Tax=Flammeovirga sp. SJP92 TaxID=1775430 RepID=UPI0007869FA8|nr:hypothetical protein [Flammeovirga sp. SJP92]KXX69659.1 hypothetical protein AVL50_15470 [Flammeovirga sp. SJP92]